MSKKIKRIKRKGQSALEFLMTYGWAMMMLMAVVGGLLYVVIPHPKSLTTNKCIFGAAMSCMGVQLSHDYLSVTLRNGVGQSVYNISAKVTMPMNLDCSISNSSLRAEEKLAIQCVNSGVLNLTDDSRINMEIKYRKTRDGYDQVIIGEIYAKYT